MRVGRKLLVIAGALAALTAIGHMVARGILGSDLVRASIRQQLSDRLGQPVQIRSASLSIFPRVALDLRDVTIGAPVAIQLGRIRIVTGLRPILSRVVDDAEVVVADGMVALPLPFALAPSAPQSASTAPALTVRSVRLLELRSVTFAAGDQTLVVDAAGTLAGDRLDIARLSARGESSRIQASGALGSIARLEGELEATADPLNLDELMRFISGLTGPADGGARALPIHVVVKLTAPSGRFAAHAFENLTTTIDTSSGRVALAPLAVRTFGGGFDGRLDIDTRAAAPALRLNGQATGFDVASLLAAAGSTGGGLTGRLGGTLALTGTGTDSATLLRSARGTIRAAITDGTFPRLDLVRTIVLAFGKPSGAPSEGSGSAFSRLGGSFTLAGGAVASSDIQMTSRDFDMPARATLQLATGTVSGGGDVMLSRELTSQAGTDLRRYAQEDGRVVIPATISGTLQQPNVSLDIAAATRRAVGNELRRRATSFLEDLIKRKK